MGEGLLRLSSDNLHKGRDDVGFGDDPQQATLLDDGQAANSSLEEDPGHIGDRGVWGNRHDLFRHDILHLDLLESVSGVLFFGA